MSEHPASMVPAFDRKGGIRYALSHAFVSRLHFVFVSVYTSLSGKHVYDHPGGLGCAGER